MENRREQIVASVASLGGIAIPVLAFRPGVNQFWLLLPFSIALSTGWYALRNGLRADQIRLKGELELLVDSLNLPSAVGARITYHEVRRYWRRRFQPCFHQIFHYLPLDKSGRGRWIPTTEGIGGHVYDSKKNFEKSYSSSADYRADMLAHFNYTPERLGQRSADRLSFMCYPVFDFRERLRGVIWFDAVPSNVVPLKRGLHGQALLNLLVQRLRSSMR